MSLMGSQEVGLQSSRRTSFCFAVTAISRGLEDLVQFVRSALGASQHHINGFSRAVVSLSSRLTDSVLSILLEDDSLPLVLEAIDQEICEEFQLLATLPREVWLALTVGMGLDEDMQLRPDCMYPAAVAAGYIHSALPLNRPMRAEAS